MIPVFTTPPSAATPFTETFRWATSVMQSVDGTEQRVQLRDSPDYSYSYSVAVAAHKARKFETELITMQDKGLLLPLWHLQGVIEERKGTQELRVKGASFWPEGVQRAILYTGNAQLIELKGKNKDWLTVLSNAGLTPGRVLIPVVEADMNPVVEGVRVNAEYLTASITFGVKENLSEPEYEWSEAYKGASVLPVMPNMKNGQGFVSQRSGVVLSSNSSVATPYYHNKNRQNTRQFSWFLNGKRKIHQFRHWAYTRGGKLKPFWAPSWNNDLKPVKPLVKGTDYFVCESTGLAEAYKKGADAEIHLRIHIPGFPVFYSRVKMIKTRDDEHTDTVQLTNKLPSSGVATEISFMDFSRLDSDEISVNWHSPTFAEASTQFRRVPYGV